MATKLYAPLFLLALHCSLHAQTPTAPKPPIPTVEPGLEAAVQWRWQVQESDPAAWGLPTILPAIVENVPPTTADKNTPPAPVALLQPPEQSVMHLVQRGDSLSRIASRYGITASQLQKANGMDNDRIIAGKEIRIPSRDEIKAATPVPPPPQSPPLTTPSDPRGNVTKGHERLEQPQSLPLTTPSDPAQPVPAPIEKAVPKLALTYQARADAHIVLMQSYLDRHNFSAGPIDGQYGPMYAKALAAYEATHPGLLTIVNGQTPQVLIEFGEAYVRYTLRPEDLQYIAPGPPDLPFEQLSTATFLPYRSAWEFVAERFHADETFLRKINPGIKKPDQPGATFIVPNVTPFEIENAFAEPIQPPADLAQPISATISEGARIEVRRGDKIIAHLPIASARPGLRGSGTWTILKAIARPKMVTTGELANPPKDPSLLSTVPAAPLGQVIAAGPNNPVGPFWLHLAKVKAGVANPLPYGLHGTSIPARMTRQEGIGGFRMANWDIARLVRLIPEGTTLTWQ